MSATPRPFTILGPGTAVAGPSSGTSTDNAVVRWDGTNGRAIQNSLITIDDSGNLTVSGTGTSSFAGVVTIAKSSTIQSTSTATQGLTVYGGTTVGTANANSGQVFLGNLAAAQGQLSYDANSVHLYIDNTFDDPSSDIRFRTRTAGSAIIELILKSASADFGGITTSGTSTTAAAILGKSLGLTENLFAMIPVATTTTGNISSGTIRTAENNTGAVALSTRTLPTAVAGQEYTFIVDDTDGIKIVANTGDIIRIAGNTGTAAGFTTSTTVGSVLRLLAIDATYWDAISLIGTWTNPT